MRKKGIALQTIDGLGNIDSKEGLSRNCSSHSYGYDLIKETDAVPYEPTNFLIIFFLQ